jgi:hypothetical protein
MDPEIATRSFSNSPSTAKLDFDQQCKQAASALIEADILLVVAGAGMSSDSGLPVYASLGVELIEILYLSVLFYWIVFAYKSFFSPPGTTDCRCADLQ